MIAAAATVAVAATEPVRSRLLATRGAAVVRIAEADGAAHPLLRGAEARWSPDGTLVVFVRNGDLWTANADGSGERRIVRTPTYTERAPSWSVGGRTIVYETRAQGPPQLRVIGAHGGPSRRIAASAAGESSPAVSRDTRRLAFVSTRDGAPAVYVARADGTNATVAATLPPDGEAQPVDAGDLAWSPDGTTLALTVEYADQVALALSRLDGAPVTLLPSLPSNARGAVWSPDGGLLAFDAPTPTAAHAVWIVNADGTSARVVAAGTATDWRRVPLGKPLFPDLVQRPPSGLVVTQSARGRWLLGFTSLVDNRGPGILRLRGFRRRYASVMRVTQLVQVGAAGVRLVREAGTLRYTVAPPHYHWHWLGFERFELRRASDFSLVVRDRKSGFCVADHYGIAVGVRHGPPRFLGNCAQFNRRARFVEEGSSVGYTDRYPANFHGQSLDLSGVRAGRYWLVHRVNSSFLLRERRYDNDAASLLLRVTWPNGRRAAPRIATLRTCHAERC